MVTNDEQGDSHELKGVGTHFSFKRLVYQVWSSLVTFFGVLFFIEIFPTILMMSLSKRFGVSLGSLYYYYFLLFLSHFPSQFTRDIEKTKKKKIKRLWRCIEALITTLLVLLKRSRWAESNDTKEVHQRWLEWATQTVQKQVCLDTFGQLVWPTPFIIDNLYWFHYIHLIEIFITVPVIFLLKYQCVFKVFFFFPWFFFFSIFYFFIINCVSLFYYLRGS
jgi:hypothetical protein